MFGRKRSKEKGPSGDERLLAEIVGIACQRYLAGPGLHIGLTPLPEGAEADWDSATGWNRDLLEKVLIVHITGSIGWISFLESPDSSDEVDPDSERAQSRARLFNPLTVKYQAPSSGDPMGSAEMAKVLNGSALDPLKFLSPVEIEVRASKADSNSWSI